MRHNDYIDLSIINNDKLAQVILFADYFKNEKNKFYRVTKDKDVVYEYVDEIKQFIKSLYEANLIQPFNWVTWKDSLNAQYLLQNPNHLNEASLEDIIKTLIVILRSDRFIGGQLKDAIEGGFITAILTRLQDFFLQAA